MANSQSTLHRVGLGVVVTVSLATLGFIWNFSGQFSAARAEILTNKRRIAEVEAGDRDRSELLRDIRERVVRVESMLERIIADKCLEATK